MERAFAPDRGGGEEPGHPRARHRRLRRLLPVPRRHGRDGPPPDRARTRRRTSATRRCRDEVRTRTLGEETKRVFRARVVNPRWIAAMRRHGYKGAFELAATVDYLFGYDATAGVVDDWMYEHAGRARTSSTRDTREFLEQSNPWALRGITERLLEAADRGLWAEPEPATLDRLRDTYLASEGDLEDAEPRVSRCEPRSRDGSHGLPVLAPWSAWTTCGSRCCSTPSRPAIGGVLVRGEKGTAKSTAVRALAALLPPVDVVAGCRFACDPAAPDPACPDGPHAGRRRRASAGRPGWSSCRSAPPRTGWSARSTWSGRSTEGVTAYEPGLLAAAHRGVLYVDEVNLLHDHLVDLLLDAAAMGRGYVEREGVSVRHAARFLLVGTMNPEEGELRPQLLDRFGLTVEVAAPPRPGRARRGGAPPARLRRRPGRLRRPLGRRRRRAGRAGSPPPAPRLPRGRAARRRAAPDRRGLRRVRRRRAARRPRHRPRRHRARRLARPRRGHRATTSAPPPGWRCRTAAAATRSTPPAWTSSASTRRCTAGRPPRRRRPAPTTRPGRRRPRRRPGRRPGRRPRRRPGRRGRPTAAAGRRPARTAARRPGGRPRRHAAATGRRRRRAAGRPGARRAARRRPSAVRARGAPSAATRRLQARCSPAGSATARRAAVAGPHRAGPHHRRPGAGGRSAALHLPATLRAAAPHQAGPGPARGPGCGCARDDLREAVREGREGNLVLFVVDASGSMAARQRMAAVKGAVLSLLLDAYQRRDKVGLVTFRGAGAELALPPTSSVRGRRRRGWPSCPPAGARRWPRGCCARRRPAAGRAAARPAPPAAARRRHRRPGHRPAPARSTGARAAAAAGRDRRGRASSSTASPARSGSAWPRRAGRRSSARPHAAASTTLRGRRRCAGDSSRVRADGGVPDAAGTSRSTCPTTG